MIRQLLLGLLLLFSLVNSAQPLDAFLNFLLFAFITWQLTHQQHWPNLCSLLLTVLGGGLFLLADILSAPLTGLALAMGLLGYLLIKRTRFIIPLSLVLIIGVFLSTSYLNSGSLRRYLAHEPKPETYRTDMDDYLRTYYLMEKGQDFYAAHQKATQENAFKDGLGTNLWSWRLPTVFYLWLWLPGTSGVSIYYAFLLGSTTMLGFSFLILTTLFPPKLRHLALIGPLLLYPYLHFAARDATLLQTEWWAMFFVFPAIYWLLTQRFLKTALFWALALMTRELLLIPFGLVIVWLFLFSRNRPKSLLIPLLAFGLVLTHHITQVTSQLNQSTDMFRPRVHPLSWEVTQAAFAFGSWEYFFYFGRIFLILYGLGVLALIKKLTWQKAALLTFFTLPWFFLKIGTSRFNDYWGVLFVPIVLISVPLILESRLPAVKLPKFGAHKSPKKNVAPA